MAATANRYPYELPQGALEGFSRREPVGQSDLEQRLDTILARIRAEVLRAGRKHPPMHSAHEGYAVLQEEVDELWDHVKADTGYSPEAMTEAGQVAAMGVRYILDLEGRG
jgi:hypothetical protein